MRPPPAAIPGSPGLSAATTPALGWHRQPPHEPGRWQYTAGWAPDLTLRRASLTGGQNGTSACARSAECSAALVGNSDGSSGGRSAGCLLCRCLSRRCEGAAGSIPHRYAGRCRAASRHNTERHKPQHWREEGPPLPEQVMSPPLWEVVHHGWPDEADPGTEALAEAEVSRRTPQPSGPASGSEGSGRRSGSGSLTAGPSDGEQAPGGAAQSASQQRRPAWGAPAVAATAAAAAAPSAQRHGQQPSSSSSSASAAGWPRKWPRLLQEDPHAAPQRGQEHRKAPRQQGQAQGQGQGQDWQPAAQSHSRERELPQPLRQPQPRPQRHEQQRWRQPPQPPQLQTDPRRPGRQWSASAEAAAVALAAAAATASAAAGSARPSPRAAPATASPAQPARGSDDPPAPAPAPAPIHPAALMATIKAATSPAQLLQIYRRYGPHVAAAAASDDADPGVGGAASTAAGGAVLVPRQGIRGTLLAAAASAEESRRGSGGTEGARGAAAGTGHGSGGGGGSGGCCLNSLHLLAILNRLAHLATGTAAVAAAAAADSVDGLSGGRDAHLANGGGGAFAAAEAEAGAGLAVVDARALGWAVAAQLGAAAAGGCPHASSPRAASNALWAAAKLRLRLRASWWEAMAAPLLAEAGGGSGGGGGGGSSALQVGRRTGAAAPPPRASPAAGPSGRDVANALYAVGLVAAAATGGAGAAAAVAGGGGDVGGDGLAAGAGAGAAVSGAARRFSERMRALGVRLLGAASAARLMGCSAAELSSMMYGAGLLRLALPPGWLRDAAGPALAAAVPGMGPQALCNVLWALQACGASPPAPLAARLLDASAACLRATAATAAEDEDGDEAAAAEATAAAEPRGKGGGGGGVAGQKQAPFRAPPSPLPPDMLGCVVWSAGRLNSKSSSGGGWDGEMGGGDGGEAGRSAAVPEAAGPALDPGDAWVAAAAGAAARTLRLQLAAPAAGRLPPPPLAPRCLAALASGLALLGVMPGGRGGAAGGEVWRLMYAVAFQQLAGPAGRHESPPPPPSGAAAIATRRRGAGGGGGGEWDPRDILALLSAAATVAAASGGGCRPPPELVTALLWRLPPSLAPPEAESGAPAGAEAGAAAGAGAGAAADRQQTFGYGWPDDDERSETAGAGGGGGGSGGGGSASDVVLVGCVWALAKLRFRPPEDLLVALLAACRSRALTLPPPALAQLVWSLGALATLAPAGGGGGGGGSDPWVTLGLAAGLRARLRRATARLAGPPPAAAAAAAAAITPRGGWPPSSSLSLPPRETLELLVGLRRLRLVLPPQLLRRLGTRVVAPAVQALAAPQRRGSGSGRDGDGDGGRAKTQAARPPAPAARNAAPSRAAAAADVRLLGALAAALGGLMGSARRERRGWRRYAAPPPALFLTSRGLRRRVVQAGAALAAEAGTGANPAASAAAAASAAGGGGGSAGWALRDVCAYLTGLRRMSIAAPPGLALQLARRVAGGAGLAGCGARELVGIAVELSYLVRAPPRPQLYGRAADGGGGGTSGVVPRRLVLRPAVADSTPAADVELEDGPGGGGGSLLSATTPDSHHPTSGAVQGADSGDKVASATATLELVRPSSDSSSPAAAASASATPSPGGALLRQRRRRRGRRGQGTPAAPPAVATAARRRQHRQQLAALLHGTLGPQLLAAMLRVTVAAVAAGARPGPPALTLAQTATLLWALSRLRLSPPAALLTPLLRASTAEVEAALDAGGGRRGVVAAADLAEVVRLAAAVAAAAPALPAAADAAAAAELEAAAAAWQEAVAAAVEGALAAAQPTALVHKALPAVAAVVAAAGRAQWMRGMVETRLLPRAFSASGRALSLSRAPPLTLISQLLDALLPLAAAAAPLTAGASGGHAASVASATADAADASDGSGDGGALGGGLPDWLWVSIFRASHRAMAAAAADGGGDVDGGGEGGGGAPLRLAAPVVGGGLPASQLVYLAYSLARYPPPRPPLPEWMQLLLQSLESDLGSLSARQCADLCVALMRLGAAPGPGWLARFGEQVELTRALTERAEHSLLSEAWLGLRAALHSRSRRGQLGGGSSGPPAVAAAGLTGGGGAAGGGARWH